MHGFQLVRMDIPGKLYWLYASSADEKAEWMAAIMRVSSTCDPEQRAAHMRAYEQYQKSTFHLLVKTSEEVYLTMMQTQQLANHAPHSSVSSRVQLERLPTVP